MMQTVRKYLVYEYVPIMANTFRSHTRESCVAQRSIYVILRGNEEKRSYIKQVSSAMRFSFSNRIFKCIFKKKHNFESLFLLIFSDPLEKRI